jgi:hypothetical protein
MVEKVEKEKAVPNLFNLLVDAEIRFETVTWIGWKVDSERELYRVNKYIK